MILPFVRPTTPRPAAPRSRKVVRSDGSSPPAPPHQPSRLPNRKPA
jgi:hypothetical protein